MSLSMPGIAILSFAHGHVPVYAQQVQGFPDARLVGCWDDDEERGRRNADALNISWFADSGALVARDDVDCVIVGSETNKHAEVCVAALQRGKAVLLQKPMATTLADCDRILEAVEGSGAWFSMAFQMRCDRVNIRMREVVQSGVLGRIGAVRRRHCIGVLFSKDFVEGPTRWHLSAVANKGMFFDDAIHAIDWLLWTFDEAPVSVTAEIGNTLTEVAPDDTGIAVFRYADGMIAEVFNSSVTLAAENTTEIYGDRGVLIQNHGDGPSCSIKPPAPIGLKLYRADESDRGWQDLGLPIPAGQGARIAGVARPFIDALKQGIPMCTAREGRKSVEMCLAAYRSATSGRRISFPFEE